MIKSPLTNRITEHHSSLAHIRTAKALRGGSAQRSSSRRITASAQSGMTGTRRSLSARRRAAGGKGIVEISSAKPTSPRRPLPRPLSRAPPRLPGRQRPTRRCCHRARHPRHLRPRCLLVNPRRRSSRRPSLPLRPSSLTRLTSSRT